MMNKIKRYMNVSFCRGCLYAVGSYILFGENIFFLNVRSISS